MPLVTILTGRSITWPCSAKLPEEHEVVNSFSKVPVGNAADFTAQVQNLYTVGILTAITPVKTMKDARNRTLSINLPKSTLHLFLLSAYFIARIICAMMFRGLRSRNNWSVNNAVIAIDCTRKIFVSLTKTENYSPP